MKSTYIAFVGAGLILAAVLGSTFTTQGTVAGTAAGPIQIGAMLCLSGPCVEWGEGSLRGAELAIAEINARGGIDGRPVELVVEDSQESDAKNALAAYQSLRQRGVEFIVGPTWTPAGLALAPVAGADTALVVSPSLGVADFNESAENLFNTWPHDETATRYLAQRLYESGIRRAAVFSSLQAWEQAQGVAFQDEFVKLGGTIVYAVEIPEKQRDFRTEALKAIAAEPDVVVFTNLTHMGVSAKQLSELGYRGQKASILMDDTRIRVADGGLDGALYVQSPKAGATFTAAFKERYGMEPGISADTAYDAVQLIAAGIERAGTSNVEEVVAALNNVDRLEGGAFGELVFDSKRGVVREPELWVVTGTQMTKYE